MAGTEGTVKLLALEMIVLGAEEMNENGCVAGVVLSAENLSLKLGFIVGGVATAMLWGAGAVEATGNGLVEGALKENADSAEGVSEGGLEAKEKPEAPEPKIVDPLSEKADGADVAHVEGTENVKLDDDIGAMLNGAEEEATVAGGVEAAEAGHRVGNAAGPDGIDGAALWDIVTEPGLGSLSPSKDKSLGAETNCFTPGFKLSSANGQSNPCVDSSSIVGAGGKIFSSVM